MRAVWATCTARRVRVREPAAPKRITFAVLTWNPWDDDALPPACKPVRDGLVDARVIHGDAPADGHEFVYGQRVSRARRGVEILIERRTGVGARA